MTPLERRCRRVVRLLPPEVRPARREEILGVLLDLSAGRSRPPLAEVAAVAALSLNLRMRERARRFDVSVLVAAVVVVTAPVVTVAFLRHLSLFSVPGQGVVELVVMLAMVALWLSAGAVWLLGYRRTAVAGWLAFSAIAVLDSVLIAGRSGAGATGFGLDNPTTLILVAAAALVAAYARAVPEPQPYGFWVWLMFGVGVLWFLGGAFAVGSRTDPVAVVAVGLAGLVVVSGRTRASGAVPALAVTVVTGLGLVPLWLGLVVVTAAVGMSFRDQPSTSLAT